MLRWHGTTDSCHRCYVVIAEGDTPMLPAYSERPWAMTAAIRVDVDGGGWTPPHPAWTLGD